MELSNIPQILTYTGLSQQTKDDALDYAKKNKTFAGEAAIEVTKGSQTPFTQAMLNTALLAQSAAKVDAASKDLDTIIANGKQQAPAWLRANWGNNGVNPPPAQPTVVDSLSAIANVSQNIVMLANENPTNAAKLKPATDAAEKLSDIVLGHNLATRQQTDTLSKQLEDGLRTAVKDSGITPTDSKGNAVSVDDFVAARFKEVQAGIDLSLQQQQHISSPPQTPNVPGFTGRTTPGGGGGRSR